MSCHLGVEFTDPKVVNFFVNYIPVVLLFGFQAGPALGQGVVRGRGRGKHNKI